MTEHEAMHICRNPYGHSDQARKLAGRVLGDYIEILERELRSTVSDANRFNAIANALGIRDGVDLYQELCSATDGETTEDTDTSCPKCGGDPCDCHYDVTDERLVQCPACGHGQGATGKDSHDA